jgi:hypothetical protein
MLAEAFIADLWAPMNLVTRTPVSRCSVFAGQALQESADKRSDLDEERIKTLLATLKQIEDTTTDIVAGMAARRARINEDDE